MFRSVKDCIEMLAENRELQRRMGVVHQVKLLLGHLHPPSECPAGSPPIPLLTQLSGRQREMAEVVGSLTPKHRIQMEFRFLSLGWPSPG